MTRFILLGALISSVAFAGGHDSNGGDTCENRLKIIRDDVASWISRGGADLLRLPSQVTLEQYKYWMQYNMNVAKVNCTDEKIIVGNSEKTCKNFVDAANTPQIVCNAERFLRLTNESDQYVLTHHEFAGLSGIEVNDTEGSNYAVSNQIAAFLEDQIVKKLVVRLPVRPVVNQLNAESTSSLKAKCAASLPQFFDQWKSAEIGYLQTGLGTAQEDLRPVKIDIDFSNALFSCKNLAYGTIRFNNAKKMKVTVTTLTDLKLGAEVCVATVDPVFNIKNDDLGRPLTASCHVPAFTAGEDSYVLKNLATGNAVTVQSPSRSDFGGYLDQNLYLFKDVPIKN